MDHTQILLKPVISEKASFVKEEDGQVIFFVHEKANKIEIKKAVEKAFGVKVTNVNVVRKAPAPRTKMGRVVGRIPGSKKAYVSLAEGDKIEFFEGV